MSSNRDLKMLDVCAEQKQEVMVVYWPVRGDHVVVLTGHLTRDSEPGMYTLACGEGASGVWLDFHITEVKATSPKRDTSMARVDLAREFVCLECGFTSSWLEMGESRKCPQCEKEELTYEAEILENV